MRRLLPLLLMLATAAADPHPRKLVGQYDGGQTEMAAGLELLPDGRFRYALSYGALDEQAAGRWHAEGGKVILDSDPVKAPVFALLGQAAAPAGQAMIALETPRGMNVQYFEAALLFADGSAEAGPLSDEGLVVPVEKDRTPANVRFRLGVFDLVSPPIAIDPARGLALRFRFEPNDLGRVDFRGIVLPIENGALWLDRFGRTIRFRRPKG